MPLAPLCALWLVALGAAPEKTKVVVLQFRSFDAATKPRAAELEELALTELPKARNLEVLGQSDLAALLGIERQKQMLGCDDASSSCLAEIGGALGAPYLVMGSVGRTGKQLRVDVKLVQVQGAKVLSRQGEVLDSEDAWYSTVTRMLKAIREAVPGSGGESVATAVPEPVAEARPEPGGGSNVGPWLVGGAGALLLAGGAVGMVSSAGDAQKALDNGKAGLAPPRQVASQYDAAAGTHAIWTGVLIAGGVVAAAGLAWPLLFSPKADDAEVSLAPVVSPGGAAVVLGGRFP